MKIRSLMQQLGEFTAAELTDKLAALNPTLNRSWLAVQAKNNSIKAERQSLLRRIPGTKPIRYQWWELFTASPRLPISASSATATPPHTSPPAPPSSCACPVPDR